MQKCPENCTLHMVHRSEFRNGEHLIKEVERCIPNTQHNLLLVNGIGNTTKLTVQATAISKGVDTHAVHQFNLASGYLSGKIEEANKRASLDTSIRYTKRIVREFVACNAWRWWVTITLDGKRWDRMNPVGLQDSLKELARSWRNKQVNKKKPYADYKYMYVPEPHESGAWHLHGVSTLIPDIYLVPYTMEDVNGPKPLPIYIINKVKAGESIFHCSVFDELYGFNVIEPLRDLDRAASYMTTYMTEDLGKLDVKTRVWHSRGLKRASKLGTYQIPSERGAVDSACELLVTIASLDAKGAPLYNENYQKLDLGDGRTVDAFRSAVAYINGCDIPQDTILKFLENNYEKNV